MYDELKRLVELVARLRGPDGCPWDREQTHRSLLQCLLDETYEFFDAVDKNESAKIKEELGDLLLQVMLHSQIGSEEDGFAIEDVARGINEKLIRRHPHVFGATEATTPQEVTANWEQIKQEERKKQHRTCLVDDIPEAMPALFRAQKIQRRVARVGFDWQDAGPALDKVEEEFGEFREAVASGDHPHAVEELGDIIFALVNVARHNGINAEEALRATNNKFIRRFRFVENAFNKAGIDIKTASLEELDRFWEEAKKEEK